MLNGDVEKMVGAQGSVLRFLEMCSVYYFVHLNYEYIDFI